jgi:hypothetical protein
VKTDSPSALDQHWRSSNPRRNVLAANKKRLATSHCDEPSIAQVGVSGRQLNYFVLD